MRQATRRLRHVGGMAKRLAFPRPEEAAWRHACKLAETTPRYTPGEIRLLDYQLRYADILTLCPQWHEIFVRQTMKFQAASDSPRILDCGANIGLATFYFKRLYPKARVTAFEADPEIHDILRANLLANGAASVECVSGAVWVDDRGVSFHCEGADSGSVASPGAKGRGMARSIPSVRLREILARQEIDLLKLDIEGAEFDVLEDCREALGNVRAIYMEAHEFQPRRQTPKLLAMLEDAGLTYALDDLISMPWTPPVASAESPFPGQALRWSVVIRAWRERGAS